MQHSAAFNLSSASVFRRIIVWRENGRWLVMALLLFAGGLFAATPVLSRLELIGSGRGLALSLGADAPFQITLSQKTTGKSVTAILSIKCSNVIYGLNEYQFSVFPHGSPVKQIVARDNKESGSVELLIRVLTPLDKNIRFKQKDTRWIILLTSAPVNDFAWSAQSETQDFAAPGKPEKRTMAKDDPATAIRNAPPQSTASSFLEDITILHRERVEKIVFKFNAATEMIVKSMPEKIFVLFVNAKNSLSHGTFKSEKDWLVKSIELKEVVHGGTLWLGASIFLNVDRGMKPLVQTFPDRLVIYSVRDTKQCLYLWSAKNGTTLSYNFISPQKFRVDLKKMETRVLSDSKNERGKTHTFSVKEPSPQAPLSASTTPPPPIIRVVITKDNVALRSGPSVAPTNTIIGRLPLGAIATQLKKKGPWIHIQTDSARGWIAIAYAIDSAKASRAFWERLEAAKIAAIKREEKMREAERILQEKKLQQEQVALAKKKALEEAKEKAREAEKIAAAEREEKLREAEKIRQEKKRQQEQLALAQQEERQHNNEKQPLQAAAQQAPIEKVGGLGSSSPPATPQARYDGKNDIPAPMQQVAIDTAPQKPEKRLIEYKIFGRDPFSPLVENTEDSLADVEKIQIVGILYDKKNRIALFEDIHNRSNAYALRENDPVKNGHLLRIHPDKAVFVLNEFGISRNYSMKLMAKEK